MYKKLIITVFALMVFMVTPAFGNSAGCKNGKFVGSYTSFAPNYDIFGDGSVVHNFILQLELRGDGTAHQYFSGLPDFMINVGSGTPSIGSWKCRQDGKLVVTLLDAVYFPVTPSPPNAPHPDIELVLHRRVTYLFSIEDTNTVKRIQSRTRRYGVSGDPTDPFGGILGGLNPAQVEYKRVEASDLDLQLP